MVHARSVIAWMTVLVLATGIAPPVVAAPTCQDLQGHVARCGTAAAMPVGWSPSAAQIFDRPTADRDSPGPARIAAMIYVVGAIFALIALMPPFDGRDGADWDEQEGDDPRR